MKFSLHIEASADAGKILDAVAYVLAGNAFITGDNDSRRRIQGIVSAWHIQGDLEGFTEVPAFYLEIRGSAVLYQIYNPEVCIFRESIGKLRSGDGRQYFPYRFIIDTQNGKAVEGKVVQEIDEVLLQVFEVSAVGGHMFFFNICNHCHHRLQMQK